MQSFTRWINFRLILVMARLIDGLRDGNGGRDRGERWERPESEGSSETEPDLTRERKKERLGHLETQRETMVQRILGI